MNPITRIRKALRGNVPLTAVALELLRKARVRSSRARERREMNTIDSSRARLTAEFASLLPTDLLAHFRERQSPRLWTSEVGDIQRRECPVETDELIADAERTARDNAW